MADGVEQEERGPASDDRVPIILVCSTDDVELADGAAAGLRARGFDVAVMGAAEDGSTRLAEVVQRFQRQGLYVLCRGGQLDRDGVDHLRAMLRSEEVPFGRTLTLPTAQGGARALEERVVSVARRMVTGRFERTDAEVQADDSDSEDEESSEPAATTPEEAVSDVGVDLGDVDRWADSLAHGAAPNAESGFGEDLPTQVAGLSLLGSEPGFEPGPETNPSLSTGQDDDYERVDKTMVTRHPISFPAAAEESSAPTPTPTPTPEEEDIDASEFSSGPNRRLMLGGGAAVVLIIVLALAFSGSDEEADPPTSDDVVAVRDDESPPKPDAPEPSAAEEQAKDQEDADGPDDREDPAADGKAAEPSPESPSEPEPAAEDSEPAKPAEPEPPTFDLEGAQKSLGHRSAVDPALLDGAALSPTAPEDRAAIAQALEDRNIRSWNAFLIAGDEAPNMTFGDAETFCKTLSAGDISGWRLPSVGELLSLSGAKLLDRKGVFWSETPGDAFGDTRIVVNAKKGSTSAVTVGWDGARPVCVRVRE